MPIQECLRPKVYRFLVPISSIAARLNTRNDLHVMTA